MNEDHRMESESSATWYWLPFVFFQCEIKPRICVCVIITVMNSVMLLKGKNYGLLCCLSLSCWLDTEMFAKACETVNNNNNNLRLIMVKTNRSTLHTVYNIQQSVTQGSNHTTHRQQ